MKWLQQVREVSDAGSEVPVTTYISVCNHLPKYLRALLNRLQPLGKVSVGSCEVSVGSLPTTFCYYANHLWAVLNRLEAVFLKLCWN